MVLHPVPGHFLPAPTQELGSLNAGTARYTWQKPEEVVQHLTRAAELLTAPGCRFKKLTRVHKETGPGTGKVSLRTTKETNPCAEDRQGLGERLGQVFFPVGLLLPHKMSMHAMAEGKIQGMKTPFLEVQQSPPGDLKTCSFPCGSCLTTPFIFPL